MNIHIEHLTINTGTGLGLTGLPLEEVLRSLQNIDAAVGCAPGHARLNDCA